MTIAEWGAIGELVASAAVVVTLVYLARQVRQANVLARAQTRQRMVEQAQQEVYKGMCEDPSIMRSLYQEEPLSETDWIKLNGFLLGSMRQREYEWFQMRDGSIDESLWKAYRGVITIHLGSVRTRKWWDDVANVSFDPDFCAMVKDFLDNNPQTDWFQRFEKLVANADQSSRVST